MSKIKITLKDGSVREYEKGTTVLDITKDISQGLARNALAAKLNGRKVDLGTPVNEDSALEILTFDDEEGKTVYRHSTAHIMAQAVKNLFPETRFGIGPAIADGYYYDFDVPENFKPDDLARIEAEIDKILKQDYPFERFEVSREEALQMFEEAV